MPVHARGPSTRNAGLCASLLVPQRASREVSKREALHRGMWTPDHAERNDRLRLLHALRGRPTVGAGRDGLNERPGR